MNSGKRSGFVKVTAIILALMMLSSIVGLVFLAMSSGY